MVFEKPKQTSIKMFCFLLFSFSFYVERLTLRFEPTETQLCKDLRSELIEANCLCKYILLPYLHDHNLRCAVLILSGCGAEALEYSSIFKLYL